MKQLTVPHPFNKGEKEQPQQSIYEHVIIEDLQLKHG